MTGSGGCGTATHRCLEMHFWGNFSLQLPQSCYSPSLHLLGGLHEPKLCLQKVREWAEFPAGIVEVLREVLRVSPGPLLQQGGDSSAPAPALCQVCPDCSQGWLHSSSWFFPEQTFLVFRGKCGTAPPEQLCAGKGKHLQGSPSAWGSPPGKIQTWGCRAGSKHRTQ